MVVLLLCELQTAVPTPCFEQAVPVCLPAFQMLALVPRANAACRALMARWLVAFCRASKWYIREDEPLEEELSTWLEPEELRQLVGHSAHGLLHALMHMYTRMHE